MFTLNALGAFGLPLPEQGEGEGEGSAETTKCAQSRSPSPRSSPLLQGARRENRDRLWRESGQSERRRNRWLFRDGRAFRLLRSLSAAGLCTAALLVAAIPAAAVPNVLPIYIEDNHAGTFYWLAQNIDLDQSYTLILFDAHSDASGIFNSDKIRNALRNVASTQDRQTLLDRWRAKGAVQCFNWIEPLMPAPIEKVIWVPAEKLSASQISEYRQTSNGVSDGHLEAAPRKSGSWGSGMLFPISNSLEKQIDPNQQLIVTIDLDYFAGLAETAEQAFRTDLEFRD